MKRNTTNETLESPPAKKVYQKYTLDFKLKVINLAKKSANKRQTAREMNIDEKLVRYWVKEEESIKEGLARVTNTRTQSPYRIQGGGRKVLNEDMELEVYEWIKSLRAQHLRVTREVIQDKALDIVGKESGFKASRGWLDNFLKRKDLSLRKKTHQGQKLPKDVADRTRNFFIYLRKYYLTYDISESDIIASDQTPIYFDSVGSSTIDQLGSKSISLRSTGHDKMNFTVMLSAAATGVKRKLFIVFSGKGNNKEGKALRARKDVYITYSDNGWFDDPVTEEYLDFLYPRTLFQNPKNRLLIWDSYKCHISGATKTVLRKKNIHTMVIPGGCTSQFQSPDVCWNAPFKNKMKKLYDQWWLVGEKSYTKHNNIRAPKKWDVVDMVLKCWRDISEELIQKSFVVCGQTKDAKPSDITCMKKGKKLDFLFEDIEKIFKDPTQFEGTLSEQNLLPDDFELETNEIIIYDDEEETFCCVICEGLENLDPNELSPKSKARIEANAAEAEAKAFAEGEEEARIEADAAEAEAMDSAEAEEEARIDTEKAEAEGRAEAKALREVDEKAAAEKAAAEARALNDAEHFRSMNESDPEITFFNDSKFVNESGLKICSSCEDDNAAKFTCKDCQETLCSPCHSAHLKVKVTKNHEIIPLQHRANISPESSPSSLPPGQMEAIIRGKMSARLLSSSDSD